MNRLKIEHSLIDWLIVTLLCAGMSVAFLWAAGSATDRYFENQDKMLCYSASESGNETYLEKCQCYYDGHPIHCIHTLRPVAD